MSSMMDSLQGVLGGGAPGGPPAGPPPGPPLGGDPASPDAAPTDPADILRQAADLIQQYISHAGSDAVETEKASKAHVLVQSLLASEQKAMDSAMGAKPEHKALAKAAQGIAGGGY